MKIITQNIVTKNQMLNAIEDTPLNILITDSLDNVDGLSLFNFVYVTDKSQDYPKDDSIYYFSSIKELEKIFPVILYQLKKNQESIDTLNENRREIEDLKTEVNELNKFSLDACELQKKIYSSQESSYFNIDIHYQYYRGPSGDFFFIHTENNKTHIVIGDVENHGTKAGLYGTSLYTMISDYFNLYNPHFYSLQSLADYIFMNRKTFQDKDTKDLTTHVLILEIDHKNNTLQQISFGAGTEPLILINHDDNKVESLNLETNAALNNFVLTHSNKIISSSVIHLPIHYSLFLYTDGIKELINKQDGSHDIKDEYSSERIIGLIENHLQSNSLKTLIKDIVSDANNYSITEKVFDDTHSSIINNAIDDTTFVLLTQKEVMNYAI